MQGYSVKRAFASIGMALVAVAIFYLTIQATGMLFSFIISVMLYSFIGVTFSQEQLTAILSSGNTAPITDAALKIFLRLQNQISTFAGVITVLIFVGIICLRRKSVKRELDLYKVSTGSPFIVPLLALSLYAVSVLLITAVPYPESWQIAYQNKMSGLTDSGSTAAVYIATVIVAPIVEEITMRGIAYKSMAKNMPRWLAMLISSTVFALLHIGWDSIESIKAGCIQALYAFVTAFAMCYIYDRYRSLLASISLHMFFNLIGLSTGVLQRLPAAAQLAVLIVLAVLTVPELIYIHRITRADRIKDDNTLNGMF